MNDLHLNKHLTTELQSFYNQGGCSDDDFAYGLNLGASLALKYLMELETEIKEEGHQPFNLEDTISWLRDDLKRKGIILE